MMNHQDEAAAVLRDLVGRIRALDGENAEIARQLREVYLEAKAASFNVKAIKQIARSGTAQSDADDTRAYLECGSSLRAGQAAAIATERGATGAASNIKRSFWRITSSASQIITSVA
jgi:uncharacterized protein (UPF0335 family)